MDIEKLIEQEAQLEFDDINAIRNSNVRSFFDEWVVTELLGRGSFGNVYRIVKPHSNMAAQECALKVCPIYTAEDADLKKQEIETQQLLSGHPNAVQIEDYALIRRELPRTSYALIRMELLKQLPDKGLSERETIRLGIDICNVLEKCAAMEPRLVHCDIKPANILVDRNGRYKLGDFGTAKTMQATMTFTGNRGTPLYMAPEVAMYTGYDGRCDIYSLGYTMLTMLNGGRHPYANEGSNADIIRAMYEFNRTPRVNGVSTGLMKIITKMCEFSLSARYFSVMELKSDLEKIIRKSEDAERMSKLEAEIKGELEKQKEKIERAGEVLKAENALEKARQALEKEQERILKTSGRKKDKAEIRIKMLEAEADFAGKVHAQVVNGDSYEAACKKIGGKKGRTFLSVRKSRIAAACAALVLLAAVGALYALRFAGFTDAVPKTDTSSANNVAAEGAAKLVKGDMVLLENGILLTPNNNRLSYNVVRRNNDLPDIVNVPAEYNGYPVTEIEDGAFYGKDMKVVNLPDSLRSIGEKAFFGCADLTEINIPEGIEELKTNAFSGCTSLEKIMLPENLEIIGAGVFLNCVSLKNIELPQGLSTIKQNAFKGCTGLKEIHIPEYTTNIMSGSFEDCGDIDVYAKYEPHYYLYEPDYGVNWISE